MLSMKMNTLIHLPFHSPIFGRNNLTFCVVLVLCLFGIQAGRAQGKVPQ